MKVIRLSGKSTIYSSNAYLVLGDWNRIEDVNTLIDTGSDPAIVDDIRDINTGLGKKKIDQVIFTHSHSDHTAALPWIMEAFKPEVLAFSPFFSGVNRTLRHGEKIRIGDRRCDILHCPIHSDDSICIHNPAEGELFVGDTPIIIRSVVGHYNGSLREMLTSLCRKNVSAVYFGHGEPTLEGALEALRGSLGILEALGEYPEQ